MPFIIIVLIVHITSSLGDTYVQSLLSQLLITDSINDSILSKTEWDAEDRENIKTIRKEVSSYYLENRYFFRVIISIAILFIALIFALDHLNSGSVLSLYFGYCFSIIAIIVNESTLWIWRINRNKKILPLIDAIDENRDK